MWVAFLSAAPLGPSSGGLAIPPATGYHQWVSDSASLITLQCLVGRHAPDSRARPTPQQLAPLWVVLARLSPPKSLGHSRSRSTLAHEGGFYSLVPDIRRASLAHLRKTDSLLRRCPRRVESPALKSLSCHFGLSSVMSPKTPEVAPCGGVANPLHPSTTVGFDSSVSRLLLFSYRRDMHFLR